MKHSNRLTLNLTELKEVVLEQLRKQMDAGHIAQMDGLAVEDLTLDPDVSNGMVYGLTVRWEAEREVL